MFRLRKEELILLLSSAPTVILDKHKIYEKIKTKNLHVAFEKHIYGIEKIRRKDVPEEASHIVQEFIGVRVRFWIPEDFLRRISANVKQALRDEITPFQRILRAGATIINGGFCGSAYEKCENTGRRK